MARMLSVDADALKKPILGRNGANNGGGGINEIEGGGVMERSNVRLLGLVMFFLFYLALGASVFSAIEAPIERSELNELFQKRQEFLKKYPCLDVADLEDFMAEIVYANNRGVSLSANGSSVPSWSFGQAFFFSSTVITTIGYGHQSPLSSEGKVFCILYAIVGVPMTLILMTAVVERLLIPVNLLLAWMHERLGHLYQPIYIYLLHFFFVLLLIIMLLFLAPAAVFASLEKDWNYLDSLYYCFISLTTIGLGDFIPGDTPGQTFRPLYKACTTFYLLAGVAAMMLCLSVFYNIPQCNLKMFFMLRPDQCLGGICGSDNSAAATRAGGSGAHQLFNNETAATSSDPERIRLQTAPSGPRYTQHLEEPEGAASGGRKTRIHRARSRPCEDSPSPVEEEVPPPGAPFSRSVR